MNDDGIIIIIVLLDMNTRLFRFPHMDLKSITVSLADFRIQSITRLINEILPIRDKQPNLLIRTSRVFARKIQMHSRLPQDRHQYPGIRSTRQSPHI